MNENNVTKNLSLSIYSFGYSAGFIKDTRNDAAAFQQLGPLDIALFAKEMGLGGIEIPVDKYFPDPNTHRLDLFIDQVKGMGLRLIFDLEQFSYDYLNKLTPYLSNLDVPFIRAKVSTFYGGNRYKNPIFYEDKSAFITNLKQSIGLMEKFNFKILIENHQDVVVNDMMEIIDEFGADRIGVNWDIGNSFPACETPMSFLKKLGPSIGNVHLKDYKLYACEEGYLMSRCPLGDGVVEFDPILKALAELGDIPLTIELGAMNSRIADINNPLYWQSIPGISVDERQHFTKYIRECSTEENAWQSVWELGCRPQDIAETEMLEVKKSIRYIQRILNVLN